MSRMKRGLTKDDINWSCDFRTGWNARRPLDRARSVFRSPAGAGRHIAFLTVNFGLFQVEEQARPLAGMTECQFFASEQFAAFLDEAIDTLNADIERFLDGLGGMGVIE